MDRLEQLVQDTLAEHAEHAPAVLREPRASRRRRWLAAAAVAATVAGLAVGVTAVTSGSGKSAPAAGDTTGPGSVVPVGYKLVSYHGIELAVPSWLPVTHSPCVPANVVYAATETGSACFASPPLSFTPSPGHDVSSANPGGVNMPADPVTVLLTPHVATVAQATVTPPHGAPTGQITVSGVDITVRARTQQQVRLILGSVRTVAIDHLGCPMRPASLTPTGQESSRQLVPGNPAAAVVCQFSYFAKSNAYWLVSSWPVSARQVGRYADALNALQDGPDRNPGTYLPQHAWVVFRYGSDATHIVDAQLDVSPAYATDGDRTVEESGKVLRMLSTTP